jgi:hypothetical protein
MREALNRADLFGGQLAGLSWAPWRAMLLATAGEPLEPDELKLFQAVTGREASPLEPVREFWGVIGRRGGKSRSMAILGSWLACCKDYRNILAPGERGEVMILAATQDQARRTLNFISGALSASPGLRKLVSETTADKIALKSGIDIVVRTASYRSARGGTSVAIICDELSAWRDEGSANPDVEILRAVRPSLLTSKGPLIAISSPYSTKGELYIAHSKNYGQDNPRILVAQAATQVMNPSLDMADIEKAYLDDPIAASAEFGAIFRAELDALVTPEAVAAVTPKRVFELQHKPGAHYYGFVDPAGGAGKDPMTLAIAHKDGKVAVLDCVRAIRPPFSPAEAVTEFVGVLKSYGVYSVTGDNYGNEILQEQFRRQGVAYVKSERVRSEIYLEFLPLVNSGLCTLLDNHTMISQLLGLERRATSGGRDKIDHGKSKHAHDDLINVAAGALVLAAARRGMMNITPEMVRRASTPGFATRRF